jgi:hypothetical protein
MQCLRILPLLLSVWIVAASQVPRVTFTVTPAKPLMDDRLVVLASGLPRNRLITVKAKSRAQDQLWWRSAAVFTSGPDGVVHLDDFASTVTAFIVKWNAVPPRLLLARLPIVLRFTNNMCRRSRLEQLEQDGT